MSFPYSKSKWQRGKIVNANLQSPQNQLSSTYSPIAVITSPGGTESCSINPNVSAYDLVTWNGSTAQVPDAVGYSWSCASGSFGGSSPSTTSTASSATWTAATPASPPQGSSAGISCQVIATPATMGPYDTGHTGPSPAGAGVTVYRPVLTANGDATGSPSTAFIGEPVTFNASGATDPTAIPGVTNNYSWTFNTVYESPTGDPGTFTIEQ